MKIKRLGWAIFLISFIFTFCTKPEAGDDGSTPAPPPPPPPPPPPVETPKVAKLSTDTIADLTLYSVTLGGKIIDTVGSKLTEQGIVVDTIPSPTTFRNFKKFPMTADDSGKFSRNIINLPSKVTFYVRAYAINQQGVGYGNEVQFTTFREKVFTGWSPTLTSQQEVNAFGANNYTTIINGLEIKGNDIRDLSPLKSIIILGGELEISGTSLQNLNGLDNLEVIGNSFYNISDIRDNSLLTDLSALNQVKLLNGHLQFVRNNALVSLNTFKNLGKIVGGGFGIWDCNNLQSIQGLDKFQYLDGNIELVRNPALTDVTGFSKLSKINGDIFISGCNALANVNGFESLTELRGLSLQFNASLTNLNGLRNVNKLESLGFDSLALLNDFSALNKVSSLNYVSIKRCKAVTDMRGFAGLTSLGWLTLENNPNLIELRGFERIQSAKRVEIYSNNSLRNLKGLDSLTTIIGNSYSLAVSSNKSMTSLTGLENLRAVQGQLFFENNGPNLDYCPLKPFLLQYYGNSFIFNLNGTGLTQAQIISNCP